MARPSKLLAVKKPDSIRIYKTAVYVRLSVEDERKKEGDSIGTQKMMLFNHIEKNSDLQLYDIYQDVDYSGFNFNRPAFNRMMDDINTGLVDCVIVKDLSRLGRNFKETSNYIERVFILLGVRFIALNDGYDSLETNSILNDYSLLLPLKNLMNELYVRDISKKIQSGIHAKQRRGEFCGSLAPYGYIKNGYSLIIDDTAASVVRQIFEWALKGYSYIKITQNLNDLNILPPNRYRLEKGLIKSEKHEKIQFWNKATIKFILKNPVYTGALVQGKSKSNYLNGGGIIKTNNDEWLITENSHPAIINPKTFASVKMICETRKRNCKIINDHISQENIFKGLIFCGDCKAFMVRTRIPYTNGKYKYYFKCNTFEQVNKHACTKKTVPESELKSKLFTAICKQIDLSVEIRQIILNIQKEKKYQDLKDLLNQNIIDFQNELEKNERHKMIFYNDLEEDIISEQDYRFLKADYDETRDRLQHELDLLLAKRNKQENIFSFKNKWLTELQRFQPENHLTTEMVSSLIERIEVYENNHIDIQLQYRDEFNEIFDYINEIRTEQTNV